MENVRLDRQVKIKPLLSSMLLLRGVIQIEKNIEVGCQRQNGGLERWLIGESTC